MTKMTLDDTWLFTEEDLAKNRAKNQARIDAANANMPAQLLRRKDRPPLEPMTRAQRRKRMKQYERKATPSTLPPRAG